MLAPFALQRTLYVPVRSLDRHRRFDHAVNTYPFVLSTLTIKFDSGTFPHEALPTIGTYEILTFAELNELVSVKV